jgi:hypothetical protein
MVEISQNKAALGSAQPNTLQASVIHKVYGTDSLRCACSASALAMARHSEGVSSRACLGLRTAPAKVCGLAASVTRFSLRDDLKPKSVELSLLRKSLPLLLDSMGSKGSSDKSQDICAGVGPILLLEIAILSGQAILIAIRRRRAILIAIRHGRAILLKYNYYPYIGLYGAVYLSPFQLFLPLRGAELIFVHNDVLELLLT